MILIIFCADSEGPYNYWPAYIFLSALFLLFGSVTIFGVTEITRPPEKNLSWSQIWKSFYLDPKVYKNFYWVILTRTLFDMGLFSILPFLSYYFEGILSYFIFYFARLHLFALFFYEIDIVESKSPALMTSIALGIIIVVSIPASLLSGK